MRLFENKRYSLFLTRSEFNIVHEVCSSMNYKHEFILDQWVLAISDYELDEILRLLNLERYRLEYDECDKVRAKEVEHLIWAIENERE